MTSDLLLVTIILPIYNAARFLDATLEGIGGQNHGNLELIIVDDGSIDESSAIYQGWIGRNPHIPTVVIENAFNLGVCNALRAACERARGEYVAQIGHDDVWLPNHIAGLVEALSSPEVVAAFGGVGYISASGQPIDMQIFDHTGISISNRAPLFTRLFSGNFLCAPASLFKKHAFQMRYWGLHNERLQDYQLWLSLLLEGAFVTVDNVTVMYRIHDSNLSAGNTLLLQSQLELFEVQQKILSSDKLFAWLHHLVEDKLAFESFIVDLHENIVKVSGYYPPLQLNFLVFLERLQEEFPSEGAVGRLRINFLTRMGALRKALLISKRDRALGSCGKDGAPLLIPANEEANDPLFQFLIETGWFADGRGIDVISRGITDFFFIVHAPHLEATLQYGQFAQVYERKRVFVVENQPNVTLGRDCRIPREYRGIGHQELDKMLKWVEDARTLGQ